MIMFSVKTNNSREMSCSIDSPFLEDQISGYMEGKSWWWYAGWVNFNSFIVLETEIRREVWRHLHLYQLCRGVLGLYRYYRPICVMYQCWWWFGEGRQYLGVSCINVVDDLESAGSIWVCAIIERYVNSMQFIYVCFAHYFSQVWYF